jgi:MarR family transcriptional regulator for hemolysin
MKTPHRKPDSRDLLLMAASADLIVNARSYRIVADKALADLGLSQATAWPIVMAGRLGDGVRQGAVADALGVEGPSLTRVIDQLVAAELMQRKEDPSDRRAKTLHLTPAGEAQRLCIESVLFDLRRRVFDGASHEDLAAFVRVLERLRGHLGRHAPTAGDEESA